MNPSIRKLDALTILSAVALILTAGCTTERGGNAQPSTSAPTGTTTSADPFNGLKACDVLNKALEGQGFPSAVVDRAGGDNGCQSDKEQYGGLTLTLQPDLGIKDLNADPSKIHGGDVNGRPAAQIRNGIRAEGDCAIAIKVTEKSRVLISAALSTGTTDEACTFVYGVAEKVETQLPKGN